jgi:hypothetical protein
MCAIYIYGRNQIKIVNNYNSNLPIFNSNNYTTIYPSVNWSSNNLTTFSNAIYPTLN